MKKKKNPALPTGFSLATWWTENDFSPKGGFCIIPKKDFLRQVELTCGKTPGKPSSRAGLRSASEAVNFLKRFLLTWRYSK